MADLVEIVDRLTVVDVLEARSTIVEIVQEGPQGPPGPIAGLDDIQELVDIAVGDYFVLHPQSFVYDQGAEVFHVEIVHPLDHRPVVTAVDSAGDVARGLVTYLAPNRVAVDFNMPFAGRFTLI